jgi:polysaccharide biosynthesis/export protein
MAVKGNAKPRVSSAAMREEDAMKVTRRTRGRWFFLPLAALLVCGWLWGQTPQAGDAPPTANPKPADSAAPARPSDAQTDYVIGAEDVLAIDVWNEKEISRSVTVRSDGAISLALVGEVQAAGKTPVQLEKEITSKLHAYISDPEVTVIVQQMMSKRFNVLGEVVKPGSYLLTGSTTVLDAIALAGGFRDFAKQKAIYVLRHNPDGTENRLPFNYKDVVKGKNVEQNIKLEARDSVVVP